VGHWLEAWYRWAVINSLWKDVLAVIVAIVLNSVWAVRLWLKSRHLDRKRHAELLDKLDASTPGGLGDIAQALKDQDKEKRVP
jgi:hypothetical protein